MAVDSIDPLVTFFFVSCSDRVVGMSMVWGRGDEEVGRVRRWVPTGVCLWKCFFVKVFVEVFVKVAYSVLFFMCISTLGGFERFRSGLDGLYFQYMYQVGCSLHRRLFIACVVPSSVTRVDQK